MTSPFLTPPQIDRELKDESDRELERLAAEPVPAGKGWGGLDDSARRSLRAANELARRARLAREQAQQTAVQAELQRRRDEENAAAVEQFKQQARVVFPGSTKDFEAAWPAILQAWQVQQTLGSISSVERKRASGIY